MTDGVLPIALTPGSLDQFIQIANRAPYLEEGEEHQLAVRLRDQDDLEAAQRLVVSHLRHVIHVARGYSGYGLALSDLVQEGCVGLMKAVKKFDPERGVRLVSFATHWIKAEINEFVVRNWHLVKIATTKAQRKLFFNLRSLKTGLGQVDTEEAERIADHLNVETRDVLEMDHRLAERPISFDRPVDGNDELAAPADYVADENSDPAARVESTQWNLEQNQQLAAALSSLDERSRHIIEARWLREPKLGLKELGRTHGVSAERIRQLESQAISKLRRQMAG